MFPSRLVVAGLLLRGLVFAQSSGATFGTVIPLGGTPSDIVLDESRSRLYLVNQNANRVDIYDYAARLVVGSIPVGSRPVAAAMSPDAAYLYVTNNQGASLSVIDLATLYAGQSIALAGAPEGVEAGFDGRVLITTQGTGDASNINSLVIFDRNQTSGQQVSPVAFPPPPPTPTPLNTVTIGRPTTTFRGKLIRTPDGRFIIGMSVINSGAQTVLFVYETASGTVLRSRTVTGQSTVLSVSPEGNRFMAGAALYDTETLNVIAQYSTANVPFPLSTGTATFNTSQNHGGSAFSPDGETLYSAFNVAPATTPATRPQASTLLISNSRNLSVRLGLKLPESIVAKMVITSDGADAWGLSESGIVHIPLGTMFDYPILQPETTTVFLSSNDCNRGLARASVKIDNIGKGKLTFSVPDATAALIASASSGLAPSSIDFTMEPGRTGVTRQYGTNLYSGGATNQGTALTINLASPEAINIPPSIRVFMNVRQTDQRGVTFPIPTGPTAGEGLYDILADDARARVYILNSGYNRIEVFDTVRQIFLSPIEAGQLPHAMALAGDGRRLYVANSGGESISIVDLDVRRVTSTVRFPPRPRAGNSTPVTAQAIVTGPSGAQVIMSDGSKWRINGEEANTRGADSITPTQFTTTGNNGPVRFLSSSDGNTAIALAGNGTAYLYDAVADEFTMSSRPYTATTINGFFGPMALAPDGSYILANGFIMNSSLALTGGSESPTTTSSLPLVSRRNVAALAPVDSSRFLRFTTPVKATLTTTPTGDARPTLELINLGDFSATLVGAVAEQPATSIFGTTRSNIPPRQLAVSSNGNAYAVTLSGLTVIPLTASGASRPAIPQGAAAVVNTEPGSRGLYPGSFVLIGGANLAASATASDVVLPFILGGSCVTFGDQQLPLLQTSAGQILGQIPATASAGNYALRVRSLATGQASDPVVVTVTSRP